MKLAGASACSQATVKLEVLDFTRLKFCGGPGTEKVYGVIKDFLWKKKNTEIDENV